LPGSIGSSSVHALQEICPSASFSEIQSALAVCNGDADEAAQQLLGNFLVYFSPYQTFSLEKPKVIKTGNLKTVSNAVP